MEVQVADELKKVALENINLEGLALGALDKVLEPILDELVADSSTPVDNLIKEALYPPLRAKLAEKISELTARLHE